MTLGNISNSMTFPGFHDLYEPWNCSLRQIIERARMLIVAGGRTVLSTEHRVKLCKIYFFLTWIFIIRKQNQLFGNPYSNFDFLIITKNLGGLAAMVYVSNTSLRIRSGKKLLRWYISQLHTLL